MILNSLFPVFSLIAMGALLRSIGLTNSIFLKTSDRLVYYIFFPVMLFWKIGGSSAGVTIPWGLCSAAVTAVVLLYLLSLLYIRLGHVDTFQAGAFSQSCYRFNTYVGVAVILNALGEAGVTQFGILIGFAIPLINVLAVATLIWFSGTQTHAAERFRFTIRALVSNPLILACVAGIAYSQWIGGFPVFVDNSLRLISLVTLPLALISIGGAITFKDLRGRLAHALVAAGFKLFALPLCGYFLLKGFQVTGIAFHVGMIFFALPTSTAIYVLSSQLNSDAEFASAVIVLSTLLSFASLSVAVSLV
mgnify:CR=1 FL=1